MERRSVGVVIASKYRLVELLGQGAYGEVWLADRLGSGPQVAIKFLKSADDSARRRFLREAEALRQLDHPHCVKVLDFGVSKHTPYLVTPYVPGETLDQWLSHEPPIADRLAVARDLAGAVAHAHTHRIVHRDIKPTNVIVERDDVQGPSVMLLDFGVAKLAGRKQTDITKTGEVVGTPGYMSTEQLRALDVGPASDVYSLGVLFFVIFAGEPPFRADTQLGLAMCHLTQEPPRLPATIDPQIVSLVAQMLDKKPGARPTMRAVLDVFKGDEHGRPPRPTVVVDRETPPRSVSAWLIVVIAACALVALWVSRIGSDDDVPPRVAPSAPNTLLKSTSAPEPEPALPAMHDAGRDAGPDVGVDVGVECGAGRACVQWLRTRNDEEVGIRVPSFYDPAKPAPILLMLHDVLQPAADMLVIEPLNREADERGMVLIAPDDNDVKATWLEPGDIEQIERAIAVANEELALDPDQIYIIGHGNGGEGAHGYACIAGNVVAMAHTSHRFGAQTGEYCKPQPGVPTMFVSMLDDPTNPITETPDCLGHQKWSLASHEEVLRDAHRCRDDYVDTGDVCQALDCKVPLTLCHPDGGRDWSAMRLRLVTNNPLVCNSPPGSFDFVTNIFRFFDEVGGRASAPEDH